jgi:hypothetical protein
VSILFGVGDAAMSAQIRAGHQAAVAEALRYLEREACVVRRGRGGAIRLAAGGSVTALFGRALYARAKTAGYLHQAVLRDELTRRLGVEWGPSARRRGPAGGVRRSTILHFSQRRHEILAVMRERGERSARAAQVATLHTRRGKRLTLAGDQRARSSPASIVVTSSKPSRTQVPRGASVTELERRADLLLPTSGRCALTTNAGRRPTCSTPNASCCAAPSCGSTSPRPRRAQSTPARRAELLKTHGTAAATGGGGRAGRRRRRS